MASEEHFSRQQVQDRLTTEMGKLMTTITSLLDTYEAMSVFKKNCPPVFNGYFNPEGAKDWVDKMEIIFETHGCLEKHKVTFATITLVEEAEDWWNSVKPSMPTTGSIILWETFKAKFLENYAPKGLKRQKVEEGQEIEKLKRIERNKKRNEGRSQKPYTKSQLTSGKSRYHALKQKIECYRCGGPHYQRNCTWLSRGPQCWACGKEGHEAKDRSQCQQGQADQCYFCGKKGHYARECRLAQKPTVTVDTKSVDGGSVNSLRSNNTNNSGGSGGRQRVIAMVSARSGSEATVSEKSAMR